MADFDEEYKSWSENVVFRPREIHEATSAADIARFVDQANADDRRVRACGSKWSFSDVPISHDYIVSMASLSRVLAFSQGINRWGHARQTLERESEPIEPVAPDSPVLVAALRGEVKELDRRFAHVHGGMILKELYLALDSPQWDTDEGGNYVDTRGRWALPTMGGSAGQNIAGIVSTSTHGADFDRRPPADWLVAIDLIAPDGTRHWFERSGQRSITNSSSLVAAYMNDALPIHVENVHYDDQAFLAAAVAMGCMGIIHSLILEVVPQFGLSQRRGKSTWLSIRNDLKNDGAFLTQLSPWNSVPDLEPHPEPAAIERHALEVFINPYRKSDDYVGDPAPDRDCLVTSRARCDTAIDDAADAPGCTLWIQETWAVRFFESGGPGTAAHIVNLLMDGLRKDTTGYPVSWSVQDLYVDPTPVLSLEIAIPTLNDQHLDLVDAMLDRFDKLIQKQDGTKLAGALGLRFTQPSEPLLAIQNFPAAERVDGTRICHIEVICLQEVYGAHGMHRHFGEDERGLVDRNDLEDNGEAFFREFEALAEGYGAHLHWGHVSLTGHHDPQRYPTFAAWQAMRDRLTSNGARRAFDNDFTVRYGISRGAPDWTPLSASLLPGSPTHAPRDAGAARRFPPTTFRNKQGCLEVLVIGCDGHVCWNRQTAANAGFLGWSFVEIPREGDDLGRNFGGRVAVGINRGDAHPEVFARDLTDGKVCHAWRSVTDKKWGDWVELDGDHRFASSPDALIAGDLNLVLVALREDGEILFRSQKEEFHVIGWNSWRLLRRTPAGVRFVGDPCLGQNLDRRLEVVTRDASSFIWRSQQLEAEGDSDWTEWEQVGVSQVGGDPAIGRRSDGRLEVFARSSMSGLVHITQAGPSAGYAGDWSVVGTFDFPLDPNGRPAVILSRRNLQVAVRAADGRIFHLDQNDDNWRFSDLGGRFVSDAAIAENDDERLEIFAKFANDFVEHRWQDTSLGWS
jgi:hypothetical protein